MSLWRNRDFLKLWAGQTVSEIGSRISREGLPLTAVLLLHASAFQMGWLVAATGVAAVVAAPLSGALADRSAHRPVLVAADLARAALLFTVPYLAATNRLTMTALLVLTTLTGFLTVMFDVHYQAFLPRIVTGDDLLEGNQKLALTASTAEVVGPGLTGALVQALTAPVAILFDAFSFLVSAVSIAWIRNEAKSVAAPQHPEAEWHGILGGYRYVFATPVLRAVLLRTLTLALFGGFFAGLYILYAIRDLGIGPAVLGGVIALGGVANLFGALVARKLEQRWSVGQVLIGATLVGGVGAMLIPLATRPWWAGALCLGASQLLGDVSYPVYSIYEITLRQQITPPHLLGRVNGCMQLFTKGLYPVGALVGGLLADQVGIRTVLFVAAAGVTASAGWLIFSPVRYLRAFDTPSTAPVN